MRKYVANVDLPTIEVNRRHQAIGTPYVEYHKRFDVIDLWKCPSQIIEGLEVVILENPVDKRESLLRFWMLFAEVLEDF